MRSKFFCLSVVVLFFYATNLFAADTVSQRDAEAKLTKLRQQLRELTTAQQQTDAQRSQAMQQLQQADEQVAAVAQALHQIEAQIAVEETELAGLESQRSALAAKLSNQRVQLAKLVRAAYALGRHEQLKMLLAQDQVSDVARVLAYHRFIQSDRQIRIRTLLGELESLARLSEVVISKRGELDAARVQQRTELDQLEQQREQRSILIQEIEAGFQSRKQQIAALGRDEKAVIVLLEKLRDVLADIPVQIDDAKPFPSRRGRLPRPLTGAALKNFGTRLPDGRSSEGILIAGTAGATVRAVAPGRVAFADWLKGYGLLLILDHGDGWMSLYASNDALLRGVGDWVSAGEPLANVGSSGGQGRPALYFELRRNGQPQNPNGWWAK